MNDISVYQGRQSGGEVPNQKNTFCAHILRLRVVIHMTKLTRPSPSIFPYSKQSKTGQWKAPGTRLGGFNSVAGFKLTRSEQQSNFWQVFP